MELSEQQRNTQSKARVQKIIDTFGCLPSVTPMTTLPRFSPLELAQGLEQNINEAGVYGHTKITIHLDLPDAHALAQFLRSRV
jgi:hypothetical protein